MHALNSVPPHCRPSYRYQIGLENADQWLNGVEALGVELEHLLGGDTPVELLNFFDTSPSNLSRLFQLFDRDSNMMLSKKEMLDGIVKHLGFFNTRPRSPGRRHVDSGEVLSEMFTLGDQNDDGLVTN